VVTEAVQAMGPDNEMFHMLTAQQRKGILHGIFEGYFETLTKAPTVYDTNRRWTANAAILEQLYPDAKLIACVRDVPTVVASFERVFKQGQMQPSVIYDSKSNQTVYDRTACLLRPGGVVKFAYDALKDMYYGPQRRMLYLMPYDYLCENPRAAMMALHVALKEPFFAYDFNKIEQIPGAKEFDDKISTPGLHDLRPALVHLHPRQDMLPPDLHALLQKQYPSFWRVKE
jgi:sulfotransferase